jgi:hypothetical protein
MTRSLHVADSMRCIVNTSPGKILGEWQDFTHERAFGS